MKYFGWTEEEIKEKTEAKLSLYKGNTPTKVSLTFRDSNNNAIYITEDDITSDGLTITTILNPDTDLVFGRVIASELTVYIFKSTKTDNIDWTKDIVVYSKYYDPDTYTYYSIDLGTFVGCKPHVIKNNGINIICVKTYDYISKLDTSADEVLDSITFPATSTTIIGQIANSIGLGNAVYESSILTFAENIFQRGCTKREILQYFAELNHLYMFASGGFMKGAEFKRPSHDIEYELTPDDYYSLDVGVEPIPSVPAVVAVEPDSYNESYPSTYTGIPYVISNNPILGKLTTYERLLILQDIKDNILTYESPYDLYYTISVNAPGNPIVEVGDIIDVIDVDGNSYPLRIFSRIFKWNGISTDYYECTGNAEREEMHTDVRQEIYNDERYAKKESLVHKRLGTFSTEAGLITALNNELSSMYNYQCKCIRFDFSSATSTFRANHYYGTLSRAGSDTNGVLMLTNVSTVIKPVYGAKTADGWTFKPLVS